MRRPGAALCIALALLASPVAAQDALSPLAEAARQRGIGTCLPSIDALAVELGKSYDIGAFLFNQIDRPDEGLASISLELAPAPAGGSVYMSANFVARPEGGCQVMIETMINWDSNCAAVGLAYPQYQATGRLLEGVSILAAQGTERLFLVPGPRSGCVSIEKSVYF